jgi:PHD/YefM family antitoxin component YafN of YafNO toxin-antitoxin module
MEKLIINQNQQDIINLIQLVNQQKKVYQIESNQDSAILISQQEYESLQETRELLSVPGLRESLQSSLEQISNHETYSLDEILGEFD